MIPLIPQRDLDAFGTRYAKAWSSHDPEAVAAMFAEYGSITINGDGPAVGRDAVRDVALSFMTAFPDLDVLCDQMVFVAGELRWYWTMRGTNTGSGGTGKSILISGYEAIEFDTEGLIAKAYGHFDQEEWDRQLGL